MENFNININGNLILFLLLIILFAGMGVIYYRRTNPPISNRLKIFLTTIRVVVLLIILFVLFEPILKLTWFKTEKPVIAVLLDTSASMTLTDEKLSRAEKALAVLKYPFFQTGAKNLDLHYYQYSRNLAQIDLAKIDTLKFAADGTDLTMALNQLYEKNIDEFLTGIILLSDGINNLGENPLRLAEEMNYPIFPISVGTPVEKQDIIIAKVFTNQISYAENEVPVNVTIHSSGYSGEKIRVNLYKDSELVDFQIVEIGDAPEIQTHLKFTPKVPGFQKYRIQIPVLKNELTPINNQQNFYVNVLKSRMKILYLTGGPGADFSFIKRVFESDPHVEVDYWIAKRDRDFYQGDLFVDAEKVKHYDCLIMQNFPPKNYSTAVVTKLSKILETEPIPLLFIAGDNVNYSLLMPLKNNLPFDIPLRESRETVIMPELTMRGAIHSVPRIDDDEFENRNLWSNLPPIFYSLAQIKIYPGTEILAEAKQIQGRVHRPGNPHPLILLKKLGRQKSMAIMGYGIWRWDLLSWGVGKSNQVFKHLLGNSIRWLINKEDSKTVRIYPTHEIFASGQEISFSAEIYNENYTPLDGAEVKLNVRKQKQSYEIALTGIGDGKYEAALSSLEGGDYSYEGIASYNGNVRGSDNGKFSVENFNLEYLQTQVDENFLKQLALKTGGHYIADSSNFADLGNLLNFPSKQVVESREWQLWNLLLLLIAAIVLFSIEWYVRKRRGML